MMVGRVYFAQAVGGGPIKIGFTELPSSRLSQLQTGSPKRMRFTRLVPGDRADEELMQSRFWRYHIRGEWFRADPELATVADAIPERKSRRVPDNQLQLTAA